MKLNVSVDLDSLEDEWGGTVNQVVKDALSDELRKLVKQWFSEQKTSFIKQLDKFGLQVIDKKIVEAAVSDFLKSIKPL